MRLIDAGKMHKAFKELADDSFTKEDISCFLYAESMIDTIPTEKAIPVEWLHKSLIDLLYDGKAKEETMRVFYKLIAKWEKENAQNN